MSARYSDENPAGRTASKRREVLAGAAWALPVAAVTSVAPAFAASQEPPPTEVVRAAQP